MTLIKVKGYIIEKLPFFILTLIVCILTIIAQKQGGALVQATKLEFSLRAYNAIISYMIYLLKTVWPVNLSFFFPILFRLFSLCITRSFAGFIQIKCRFNHIFPDMVFALAWTGHVVEGGTDTGKKSGSAMGVEL